MRKTIIHFLVALILGFCIAGCGAVKPAETIPDTPSRDVPSVSEAVSEPPVIEEGSEEEKEPVAEYTAYNWRLDTPENHGVDGETLQRLHSALDGVDINSAVTVKDGYIIDEYYKDGYDENSVFGMASVTKTFSGALIGIAIEKGLISGVDAKLTDFFPQLNEPDQEDKSGITVEHLLTHTSGIYWSEWSGGDYFRRLSRSENWVDFIFSQEMSSEPGTVFNYTTGGSHLLGAVIQESAGMTEFEFGVEYLFKPLGMESVKWRSDPQGITDGGNGISMTARDAAKLGQLYLEKGKWGDVQVIPEDWVELSVQRQAAGSPGTGEYGYCWWLRTFGGYSACYAMGHGGQYIFVVPELNLVTVMTSKLSDTYLPQSYFGQYIITACM